MTECVGFLGRLFGHHYRARYNSVQRPNQDKLQWPNGLEQSSLVKILAPLTDHSYIGDVCTRCGHVVNRSLPGEMTES